MSQVDVMSAPRAQGPLCLEGDLTIYRVAELKPSLLELVERCDAPALDLSAVTELDTAGLQLLVLVRREVERAGKRLTLIGPSPAVIDVLQLCHLDAWLTDGCDAESSCLEP